jgi:hypothetical protein
MSDDNDVGYNIRLCGVVAIMMVMVIMNNTRGVVFLCVLFSPVLKHLFELLRPGSSLLSDMRAPLQCST